MNNFEEKSDSDYEDDDSLLHIRGAAIAISNHNNKISIIANVVELKDRKIEEHKIGITMDEGNESKDYIIDVNKITKNKSIDDLKILILNEIGTKTDEAKIYSDVFDEKEMLIQTSHATNEVDDNNLFGLDVREKGQKLTVEQIKRLKEIISGFKVDLKEISAKYNISYTVLNRIKKKQIDENFCLKRRKINWIYGARKEIIEELIHFYFQNYQYTTTAQEITEFINHKLHSNYNVDFIRKLMKSLTNLSFKKVKSRPSNIDFNKIKFIRKLFALKFAKIVSSQVLVVNIDESSINRGIMSNYSWGLKGVPIESKNCIFSGSLSLITAICSNDAWLSFMLDETIDSTKFVWFIKILHNWIVSNDNFGYNEVMILLDNWSFHKSSTSASLLIELRYKITYLPLYSPDFAPIEMFFSILKKNLSESWKKDNAKVSLKINKVRVYNSLIKINEKIVKNLFGRLFSYVNEYI